ncbi:MAG: M24 family metallopeptidase, partial [Pseudomonadota bacterium]
MSGVPAVPFDLSARARYARNAFHDDEYARRAATVRATMAAEGLSALIVFGEGRSPAIEYLTGFQAVFGKHILLLTEDHATLFTDGVLHGEPMHSMIWTCRVADVVVSLGPTYGAPFEEVASLAAARLSSGTSVGVSDAHLMPRALWAQLDQSGAILLPSDAVGQARAFKSPAEVAVLKEACAIADRALTAMIAAIKPGKTEAEIGAIAAAIIAESGASEAFPTAVSSGHYAGIKHATPGQRVMEAGEPVFLDVG